MSFEHGTGCFVSTHCYIFVFSGFRQTVFPFGSKILIHRLRILILDVARLAADLKLAFAPPPPRLRNGGLVRFGCHSPFFSHFMRARTMGFRRSLGTFAGIAILSERSGVRSFEIFPDGAICGADRKVDGSPGTQRNRGVEELARQRFRQGADWRWMFGCRNGCEDSKGRVRLKSAADH